MKLLEYLNHPDGAHVPLDQAKLRDVNSSINAGLLNRIILKTYKFSEKILVFHCQLPSRTKKTVKYDVVIEAHLGRNLWLDEATFRTFSNSPSFIYRYAQAFAAADMLCTWLSKKYDGRILTEEPKKFNVDKKVGFEFSIYTCITFIMKHKYAGKDFTEILKHATPIQPIDLAKIIHSQESTQLKYSESDDTRREMNRKKDIQVRKDQRDAKRWASKNSNVVASIEKSKKSAVSKSITKAEKSAKSKKL